MNVRGLVAVMATVCLAASCGDRETRDSEQPEPPQPFADTAEQQKMFTPPGGLPDNPKAPPGTVGDGTVGAKVEVEIKDDTLTLSQTEIPPGPVTFNFSNETDQRHILEISWEHGGRWRSVPVGKGGSIAMSQSMERGSYEAFCYAPGHKDKGEKAKFVVK